MKDVEADLVALALKHGIHQMVVLLRDDESLRLRAFGDTPEDAVCLQILAPVVERAARGCQREMETAVKRHRARGSN